MADTFFTDTSEFQAPYDRTYPWPIASFRFDTGYRLDNIAATNWARLSAMLGAGQLRIAIAYCVHIDGAEDAILARMRSLFGRTCPSNRLVLMVDMESGADFAGPGDHTTGANYLLGQLAAYTGSRDRVLAYANRYDYQNNWPGCPPWVKRVTASYGQQDPGSYAWQYTGGGSGDNPPQSYPRQSTPFAGNVDHNVIHRSIGEIERDFAVTTTPPPKVAMGIYPGAVWRGNCANNSGPRGGPAHGLILHVNDGPDISLWGWVNQNSSNMSTTFQVRTDGTVEQYLDTGLVEWCQSDGNRRFGSMEMPTHPNEGMTAAQLESGARVLAWWAHLDGFPLQLTNDPGGEGFGWHGMGGDAWGGHLYCLPLDVTDVLTPGGWLPLRDVTPTSRVASYAADTGLIEFAPPVAITESYTARTVTIGGIEMTPDHRLYVYRSDHSSTKVLQASEIGEVRTNWLVPAQGVLAEQPGCGVGVDLMRLLVWVQADGHYQMKNGRLDHLNFHFRKERKVVRVCELLDALGKDYRVSRRADGTTVVKIYGVDWIRENVLRWLPEKRWTWDLLDASPDEFAAIDGEITDADGYARGDMRVYSTSIRQNADVIQALYVTHGRSAAIHPTPNGWMVQMHIRRHGHALRDTYRTARESTLVGCLTTQDDTILIRQNGRVMVVGNCPGDIRRGQMAGMLARAVAINGGATAAPTPTPTPAPKVDEEAMTPELAAALKGLTDDINTHVNKVASDLAADKNDINGHVNALRDQVTALAATVAARTNDDVNTHVNAVRSDVAALTVTVGQIGQALVAVAARVEGSKDDINTHVNAVRAQITPLGTLLTTPGTGLSDQVTHLRAAVDALHGTATNGQGATADTAAVKIALAEVLTGTPGTVTFKGATA